MVDHGILALGSTPVVTNAIPAAEAVNRYFVMVVVVVVWTLTITALSAFIQALTDAQLDEMETLGTPGALMVPCPVDKLVLQVTCWTLAPVH